MDQTIFDAEVERILNLMKEMPPESENYRAAVESLKILCEARSKKTAFPIEPDTIVLAVTNILGILLILQYERLNVISTRAISFVRK